MEIKIVNVRKEFARYPALHDVSLDIRHGELVALLGPSGSGKTTLLRLVAGLDLPTSGTILFGDEDASQKTVQDRNVGFVFQHYALFRHLTVAENIGFGLKVRPRGSRPAAAEIRRKASELLDLVQLPGLEDRFPAQLSGGQRQRVALARALAIEPRVLLLDEPFGALDARVRRDLRRWLRELHDRTGHTTVFVTHDQEEALELADRLVVINDGRVEQIGTPDDIYDRPATPFVASFIGEANLIPVTVRKGCIVYDGEEITPAGDDFPDGPATLMARPHDFTFGDQPKGSMSGTIIGNRRSGARRRIEAVLGTGGHKAEIDLPSEANLPESGRIHVKPLKWRLFPGDRIGDEQAG